MEVLAPSPAARPGDDSMVAMLARIEARLERVEASLTSVRQVQQMQIQVQQVQQQEQPVQAPSQLASQPPLQPEPHPLPPPALLSVHTVGTALLAPAAPSQRAEGDANTMVSTSFNNHSFNNHSFNNRDSFNNRVLQNPEDPPGATLRQTLSRMSRDLETSVEEDAPGLLQTQLQNTTRAKLKKLQPNEVFGAESASAVVNTAGRALTHRELEMRAQEQRASAHCLLHPQRRFRFNWDLASCLLILFMAISLPYRIAFVLHWSLSGRVLDFLIDAFFMLDIVINLRTMIVVNGELITSSCAALIALMLLPGAL